MADFSIDQLNAVQAGMATSDTLKNVANAARNAACTFFKAYPSVVIPNPAFDFLDSIWDGLCQNSSSGLPPAPVSPFNGGQCVGDNYQLTYQFDVFRKSDSALLVHANYSDSGFTGKIRSIVFNSGQIPDTGIGIFVTYSDSFGNPATYQEDYGSSAVDYGANFTYSLSNLTHPADACGNPPQKYPTPIVPPTPVSPGSNTYNLSTTNVTYNNGNTYPVTPTLNLNASLSPVIQVGGINVSVGGGGVTVGGGGNQSSVDPTSLLNKIATNLGDGTVGGGGVGAAAASAAKNTAPVPPPGGAGTMPPVPKPPKTPTVKGVPNLSSVQIFITTLPTAKNMIFATDSAYNVYIAGWFEWLQGDLVVSDRFPIQAQNTTWFAPKGSDGYTFTLTNGASGYSQVSQTTS
jgi:hypothetical protein